MSDSKFDDKIRDTLEGHEPEATPNWNKMRDRIAAAAAIGSMGVDAAGSKIATQLYIGAAVVIGAASMWIAQQFIEVDEDILEDLLLEEVSEVNNADESDATDITTSFEEEEDIYEDEVKDLTTKTDLPDSKPRKKSSNTSKNSKSSNSAEKKDIKSDKEKDLDSLNEISKEIDEVSITASTQTSCVGAQVSFEVEGSDISKSYLWNFGDGSFSSDPNPIHTYEMPGVYDVTLSLRTTGKGSIQTRTIENLITINPQPIAKMSWSFPRIIIGNNVPVELIDQTLDTNDATWIVDGNILSSESPRLENPGTYQVNLIASNQYGCQDHTSNIVIVGNRNQINAPARFSPDGDGRYDSFMPFDLSGMSEKWELVIANKDGEEVFSSSEFDKPWNGELANGELAKNSSVFYWTVLCTGFDGNQRVYSDKVVVER
ncbi:MAG: hypothetical protein CL847_05700 [Crocinitomicaceae bacterium]|nr:hypothetical protein [Crocinitomicaceae bacterium]|tara:strand:+ start:5596 stop:6885 length:1290 start_codon:yes stop_codon:yes gene_type:complete